MKTIRFCGAQDLLDGIALVASELGFTAAEDAEECDITVTVSLSDTPSLKVDLDGGQASIVYGGGKSRFFRALGLLCQALQDGETVFECSETPSFQTNGPMFDMSRNNVMRPDIVKALLRKCAVMGLNMFMLYTEDTYEVENRPYFGHMRGRYTCEELRDMDAYARILGIELIPCVQFLGHFATALQWDCMKDVRDTHEVMRIDEPATYELIEDMMRSISQSFTSRRLHMGMDESFFLGHGQYLRHHEPVPQQELFCRHLRRVLEMAKKYGFQLMMWSDMFFEIASKKNTYYDLEVEFTEDVLALVPREVAQVYWDYDHEDEAFYDGMIASHKKLCSHTIFAGGIWTWLGPAPMFGKTIATTVPALTSCVKNHVDEVIATVWNNGAEGSLITALYGLQIYAEMDYTGGYDPAWVNARFSFCCGADAQDFLDLERANHPDGGDCLVNPSRYLLWNDPLVGLMDAHVGGGDCRAFYRGLLQEFEGRGEDNPLYAPAFRQFKRTLEVLEYKADYGVRLKESYDARDTVQLRVLFDEAQELKRRFAALRDAHREAWYFYNKPFGFEMMDMMYGALISRFDTVRYELHQFFDNPRYCIAQLEQPRLPFAGTFQDAPLRHIHARFGRIFTTNIYATVSADSFLG